MLARLVLRMLINACALAAAAHFVGGIGYDGYSSLLAMALIFGLVNAMIRPVVTVLSCPLLVLTLGLFTFVINGAMLYLAGTIASVLGLRFHVNGFGPAFWGALVVSFVSFVLSLLLRPERRGEKG